MTSAFDPKEYEQRVVRPLRGRTGRLPDDLVTRYAVELEFSDEDLAARLTQVRAHWNKAVSSVSKSSFLRRVYQALLSADEELRREHGDDMLRISWWREHERSRAGARKQRTDELVAMLREEFGDLGLITAGQLEAIRESFGRLGPEDVDRALETAGVRQSTPVALPRASGLGRTLYRRLHDLLAETGVAAGIPELLHGELRDLRLLDEFASTPERSAGLTGAAVRQAIDRENRRDGNRAAREALGILDTAVHRDGVDLRELALFHLLDGVRRHHDNRAPTSVLLRELRACQLDETEARNVVVSVLDEDRGDGAEPPDGLSAVHRQLADGLLREAERTAATIADPEQSSSARTSVQQQASRVRELREGARRALVADNEAEARKQLAEAARLAADDEELEAELGRIPPPPVLEVAATPDGSGARVSWRAPAEHGEGTRYRLVRRKDRAPSDSDDGDVVAEDTATVVLDAEPSAAIRLRYAVFAASRGGFWSRPAQTECEVLPPVHDVRLRSRAGVVEASWKVPSDVVAVDVRRLDGAVDDGPVGTVGLTSFRDVRAESDRSCSYVLRARYRREDGSEASSVPVRVESAPAVTPTLPSMTGIDFQRLGDAVVVSWVWPQGVGIAEVVWTAQDDAALDDAAPDDSGRCRITRQEYRSAGGCRLQLGSGTARVRVRGIEDNEGADACSEAVEIVVPATAPRVRYTVVRRKALFGPRTARFTFTANRRTPECTVLVVASEGRTMPQRRGEGQVLHRFCRQLRAEEPVELTVELPKLRRPYWLRCFTEEPSAVGLVDPPTAQLKAV